MAAQIIPLSRRENVDWPTRLRSPIHARLPSPLTRAARRYWHRARLCVEGIGWIVVAASMIAAMTA